MFNYHAGDILDKYKYFMKITTIYLCFIRSRTAHISWWLVPWKLFKSL